MTEPTKEPIQKKRTRKTTPKPKEEQERVKSKTLQKFSCLMEGAPKTTKNKVISFNVNEFQYEKLMKLLKFTNKKQGQFLREVIEDLYIEINRTE